MLCQIQNLTPICTQPIMLHPLSKVRDILHNIHKLLLVIPTWEITLNETPTSYENHHKLLFLQLGTPNTHRWNKTRNIKVYKPPSYESHSTNISDSLSCNLQMKFIWEIWVISPLILSRVESFTTKTSFVEKGTYTRLRSSMDLKYKNSNDQNPLHLSLKTLYKYSWSISTPF